jgi:hypothetical protein
MKDIMRDELGAPQIINRRTLLAEPDPLRSREGRTMESEAAIVAIR